MFDALPFVQNVTLVANDQMARRRLANTSPNLALIIAQSPEQFHSGFIRHLHSKQHPRPYIAVFGSPDALLSHTKTEAKLAGADRVDMVAQDSSSPREYLLEIVERSLRACGRSENIAELLQNPPTSTRNRAMTPEVAQEVTPIRAKPKPKSYPKRKSGRIDLIAIGSSTGGPQALATLFSELPGNIPVPIVITQHVPAGFAELLAGQLRQRSAIEVRVARHGEVLRPNCAWIAPHDSHLGFEERSDGVVMRLRETPRVHSCRPAVDPMLQEATEVWGPRIAVAILTGMGYDGRDGCEVVHRRGGYVIAQDEKSSVVWGMPGAVAESGCVHEVLDLDDIAHALVKSLRFGRTYSPGPSWRMAG